MCAGRWELMSVCQCWHTDTYRTSPARWTMTKTRRRHKDVARTVIDIVNIGRKIGRYVVSHWSRLIIMTNLMCRKQPLQDMIRWWEWECTSKTLATCQPSCLYNLLQVQQPSRALRYSTQKFLQMPFLSTGRVSYLIYVSMRHYVLTTSGDIVVCFYMAVCLSF